jgi:hypothetical protein
MPLDCSRLADEFIARVQAATLTPTTEVDVVYYCVDERGNDIPPFRMSMVPLTRVSVEGDPAFAAELASTLNIGSIIDNINALVRPATADQFSIPRDAPRVPMRLVRMELDITDL